MARLDKTDGSLRMPRSRQLEFGGRPMDIGGHELPKDWPCDWVVRFYCLQWSVGLCKPSPSHPAHVSSIRKLEGFPLNTFTHRYGQATPETDAYEHGWLYGTTYTSLHVQRVESGSCCGMNCSHKTIRICLAPISWKWTEGVPKSKTVFPTFRSTAVMTGRASGSVPGCSAVCMCL